MPEGDAQRTRLTVTPEDEGQRLDRFVAGHLPSLSRSRVHKLITDGHVTLSEGRAKPALAVWDGLVVDVTLPKTSQAAPGAENIPLEILYEDADLAAINKPAGLVVHPGAGHATGTLVNALLHHLAGLSGIGGVERPGIVHRLDRGTSGVLVVAKTDAAHRGLSRQFHDREVVKEYVALVWGALTAGTTLSQPIGRDPRRRQKMSTRARHARPAETRVLEVEALGGVSFVRLAIGTGRTHQIRVHLSEAGHPVVGDDLYGGGRHSVPPRLAAVVRLKRPFLHAARLGFAHPSTGVPVNIEAPLAKDLHEVLDTLRRGLAKAQEGVTHVSPVAPKRLGRKIPFTGRVFRVESDRVGLSNGRTVTLDIVRHRGSVVLIPQPSRREVILVRQYRYAIGKWIWELPAGTLDPGESARAAARRECAEEIGLSPRRITKLGEFYPTPGFCDEVMIFFRCSGLERPKHPAALDLDEQLEPRTFSLAQVRQLIKRRQVVDMKTVVGLTLLGRP